MFRVIQAYGKYPDSWLVVGLPFFMDFVTVFDYANTNITFGLNKDANEGAAINPPTPTPTPD